VPSPGTPKKKKNANNAKNITFYKLKKQNKSWG